MLKNKLTFYNIALNLTVFLSFFLITGCQGQSKTASHKKTIKDIRETMTKVMKDDLSPGMSVALINKDKIVYSQGFGVTNIETQQAVTADTSFWLASISKTAIAVSIMHAKERGLIDLDVDVYNLLKNQAGVTLSKPFEEPVLLKYLVNHTSSIIDSDYYDCTAYVGDENGQHYNLYNQFFDTDFCDENVPVTLLGYLKAYLSEGQAYYSETDNFLQKKPGTETKYSNIGAALAGYVLEVETGMSLADYAKTYIFTPLQMDNTSWRLNDLDQTNIAIPHIWDKNTQKMSPLPLYSYSTWPDGGLRSSANDLAKYLLMVMNKGEINNSRILSIESIRDMLPATDRDVGIGVFWQKGKIYLEEKKDGRTLIGHDGVEAGAYTYMQYDPDDQVGIIILANGDDGSQGTREIDRTAWIIRHITLINKLLDYAKELGS